jgi:glycosyltransferase involved in cell wall biosynthesis
MRPEYVPEIVMLLSNAFRPDPRVEKEAKSLAGAGYSVTVICWDRKGELPAEETLASGVRILRVQEVRSTYRGGAKQILYTPRFWSAAISKALALKPALVHCHDLDTLYAGVQIKKRLGCQLLFDAHEDYSTQMSLYLPGFFTWLLNLLEGRLLRHVDAVIAASTLFMDKLSGSGFSNLVYLPNVQDLSPFEQVTKHQISQARQKLGLDDLYLVSYIGGFSRNRLLLPLLEALRDLPQVSLLLAGDGHQRPALEQAIQGMPNVHYLGWLPASQVPLFTCLSDVIYYCLKSDYPGVHYNAPNTLSNAMAAARPILANNVGDLGRIVQETGCGLLLEDATPETIRGAILELNDPALRSKLGEAGRLAAQREYNWQVVEQRLLSLYDSLVGGR